MAVARVAAIELKLLEGRDMADLGLLALTILLFGLLALVLKGAERL